MANRSYDLITVISRYPQLTQLHAEVVKSYPLTTLFHAADNFSLLAPSNVAISTWLASYTTNVSQSYKEAVFSYHLLHGRYATASITTSPITIRSELTHEYYTNITGGQRVEVLKNGTAVIQSGAKAVSRIITGV